MQLCRLVAYVGHLLDNWSKTCAIASLPKNRFFPSFMCGRNMSHCPRFGQRIDNSGIVCVNCLFNHGLVGKDCHLSNKSRPTKTLSVQYCYFITLALDDGFFVFSRPSNRKRISNNMLDILWCHDVVNSLYLKQLPIHWVFKSSSSPWQKNATIFFEAPYQTQMKLQCFWKIKKTMICQIKKNYEFLYI